MKESVPSSNTHLVSLPLRERVEVDLVNAPQSDHRDVLQTQLGVVRVAQRQLGSLHLELGQIRHVLVHREALGDRVEGEVLDYVRQHLVDDHVHLVVHHVGCG